MEFLQRLFEFLFTPAGGGWTITTFMGVWLAGGGFGNPKIIPTNHGRDRMDLDPTRPTRKDVVKAVREGQMVKGRDVDNSFLFHTMGKSPSGKTKRIVVIVVAMSGVVGAAFTASPLAALIGCDIIYGAAIGASGTSFSMYRVITTLFARPGQKIPEIKIKDLK